MNKVYVRSFWCKMPDCDYVAINTTSHGNDIEKTLSPFYLGPVFFGKHSSENMENAWQYSKVYKCHLNKDGTIKDEYFEWRKNGFAKKYADRYPLGKGKKPEYVLLEDQQLKYIDARKQLYIPLYRNTVINTMGYQLCKDILKRTNIVLLDFDAYDHEELNMTMEDVVNCETRKMGHAFVLKMLLDEN